MFQGRSMCEFARPVATGVFVGMLAFTLVSCNAEDSTSTKRVMPSISAAQNGSGRNPANEIAFRRITPSGLQGAELPAAQRVIRGAAEFAARWQKLAPETPVPEIDFGRQVVAFVAVGFRPNPGHRVQVTRVFGEGSTTVVCFSERRPEPDREYPAVLVFPFDMVVFNDPGDTVVIRRCRG